MLTDGIVFTNLETTTITFGPGTAYSIEHFDVRVDQRIINDRQKMEQHGLWPTKSYASGMVIDVGGAILADDSDDYNDKRILLAGTLRGDPTAAITQTKMGQLAISFDGQTEDWLADVTIAEFTAALEGASPMYSDYLISFQSWDPWFVGATSNNKFWYS